MNAKMNAKWNEAKNSELLTNDQGTLPPGILLLFLGLSETQETKESSRVLWQPNACLSYTSLRLHQCVSCGFTFLCKLRGCPVENGRVKAGHAGHMICKGCEMSGRVLEKNLESEEKKI